MKALIVFVLAAVARAGAVQYFPEVGFSTQHRTQDVWGNYNFGYDEKHSGGGSWRKESSDASGNTVGSYGLHDADGRVRIVNYVANAYGFRASVATNEPGTAASSPAGVGINAPQGPTGPRIGTSGDAGVADVVFAAAAPVAAPVSNSAVGVSAPVSKLSLAATAPAVTYAAAGPAFATAPAATNAVKFVANSPAAFVADVYGPTIRELIGYAYGKRK
ncbi:uncharacterized protein [Dermacentor andersoni]|uniref:uncharacterized protein n=1 Tax=Dermacentor andersoni TaxID=34620 RepID=UPI002415AA0A|nr:adult-specific rigid cuticular protein 15.7-like [Dermacentor andersoni]